MVASFWGYLQIRHFINSGNLKPPGVMPVYCDIDDFFVENYRYTLFQKRTFFIQWITVVLIIVGILERKISVLSISMTTG